ncbi:MAG: Rieske 2Fe-2S domain-containing protein [Planctomycetota bacterium]|nr:Rieske 2Fe-2S domain-containing protein [Planctomycetota bacterium]
MSDEKTEKAAEWTDLCALGDVPANGGGKFVGLKTAALAVFRLDAEKLQVLDDTCPHAGGSLASGYVSQGVVYCPWHAWPFKICSGECPDNPSIKVKVYPVRVVDGRVQAQV